ncbi:hypothetical protein CEUSTIGMA_g8549.t1 [Chlamydomonas eustigma]|uniref:Chromo domain-containing protein n=1 Tax=Chlamydomonas eustigma TaxID=1157962 RepID=A0A250XDF5_9CHLO|nr:hypothetical protein CEUSTIGMA_g8549.t1 [Chlamydomonas eustigma]|eukprot:GAX81115.1 hypothetical protein CEUSTIGMA_g8549.t1 [Chlamydomonas eustigma]
MSASLPTSVMNDPDECGIGGTSDSNLSSNDMIQQQQEENEAFGLENTAVVTQREGGRKLGLLSEEGRRGSEADTLALQTETDRGTEKIKTGQRGCMPLKKTVSRQQTPVSLEIKHCGADAEGINANASVYVNKKKTIKQEKSVKMSKKKPLPPLDGKNEFYVDRVMQYTREDNLDFFLIRWWGYGSEDDTWETISAFSSAPGSYTWECPMPEQFRIGG